MKIVSPMSLTSKLSEILRELEATGEEVLVMDKGQLVLKIISYSRKRIEDDGDMQNYEAVI